MLSRRMLTCYLSNAQIHAARGCSTGHSGDSVTLRSRTLIISLRFTQYLELLQMRRRC